MKASFYQLCEMLRTATGYPHKAKPGATDSGVVEYLLEIWGSDRLRLPFDVDSVFVIPDRLPVLSDILRSTKSLIVNQLGMRREDTGLVVDSLRSGKDALFFAHLCASMEEVAGWVRIMNPRTAEATLKTIDDEHVLILTSVCSFVPTTG